MRIRHAGILTLVFTLATPSAVAYTGRWTCSSINYRYASCQVNTQGRVVLLREVSTGNLCRQGRTWGFDNRQIWVSGGCRAEFGFGRGSDGGSDNSGAAIAAGVIGALALGAIIGSQNPTAPPPPPPPPPQFVPPYVAPPGWAIGSFFGFDTEYNAQVQLVVGSRARVFLRDQNGVTLNEGDLRDGTVYWVSGRRSWLAREPNGVTLGDIETGRSYFFRRA